MEAAVGVTPQKGDTNRPSLHLTMFGLLQAQTRFP